MSIFSLHKRLVEIPLWEWNSFVFLYAAACGAYEHSTCSGRRLINYASTPFPAGESIGICSLLLNSYLLKLHHK